jgi:integrase
VTGERRSGSKKERQPAGPRKADDGSWYFTIDLPRGPDGKRHQARRRGFATRKEAREAFDELAGTKVSPTKLSTAAYLDRWLAARHDLRPGTRDRYAILLRVHVRPAIGHVPVQKLEPSHLDALYTKLRQSLKPRTVRFVHSVVRKALADGVRRHELARNVADDATPPSSKESRAPATAHWKADELGAFLAATADHEHGVLFRVAAMSGLRRGELGALRWRDLDLEAGKLSVTRGLVQIDGAWTFAEPKTERARRTISIDPATVAALRQHRKAERERRFALGAGWTEHDLVFPGPTGGPSDIDAWGRNFARAVRDAGLPRITFHGLRHTHATLALGHMDVSTLSARLGHATAGFTLNVYGHPRNDADAVAGLAAAVDGVTNL